MPTAAVGGGEVGWGSQERGAMPFGVGYRVGGQGGGPRGDLHE